MRLIAGRFGGRRLKTSNGEGYRPAMGKTRGALFSMLEARGVSWPSARVLDLFAGSGSLAFECLSRGAPYALLVERALPALRCLRANVAALGVESQAHLCATDVARLLRTPPEEAYSLVFLDPPYRRNLVGSCLRLLVANAWLVPGAVVTAEIEKDAPLNPPPCYTLSADRRFGETRILIWRYTPEHDSA